jgi:uncharacterized protein YndB with AHSA1/START domain
MKNRKIKIVRVLSAPIEKVWDAWTNPESLKNWKSPEGMSTPEAAVDLVVGGKYHVTMEGYDLPDPRHNGRVTVRGEYLEIKKPTKLVYTWLWDGSASETHTTTVTITLRSVDKERTELTLIHAGFVDDEMKKEHDKGWGSTINKLEMFLAG